jgi:hypothetical protein
LLRARRKRKGSCSAADRFDEITPSHVGIPKRKEHLNPIEKVTIAPWRFYLATAMGRGEAVARAHVVAEEAQCAVP